MDESEGKQVVERTWKELGYKFRPWRRIVLVRTDPIPTMTSGGIHLPPKLASFYGELPHIQLVTAIVLASGPECELKAGDRIGFQRLYFARWLEMDDNTLIGWISDERNVVGLVEGDPTYVQLGTRTKPNPPPPPGLQ